MENTRRWLVIGSTSTAGAYFVDFILSNTDDLVIATSRQDPYHRPWEYPFLFNKKEYVVEERLIIDKFNLNYSIEEQYDLIIKYCPTHIINFACLAMVGQSWQNPEDWYKTNVIGQSRLMQAISRYKDLDLYIHFSTPEVYGNMNDYGIESSSYNPSAPYAASRASGDLISKMWAIEHNIPMVTTRASSIYCEGQHLYRIIPRSLLCALKQIPLKVDGIGDVKRQYLHMEDISVAILKIIETLSLKQNKYYEEYHIGSDKLVSINEIIEMSALISDQDIDKMPIRYGDPRKGSDMQYLLDSKKLKQLGWKEKITLQIGLTRVRDWITSLPDEALDHIQYIHRP